MYKMINLRMFWQLCMLLSLIVLYQTYFGLSPKMQKFLRCLCLWYMPLQDNRARDNFSCENNVNPGIKKCPNIKFIRNRTSKKMKKARKRWTREWTSIFYKMTVRLLFFMKNNSQFNLGIPKRFLGLFFFSLLLCLCTHVSV